MSPPFLVLTILVAVYLGGFILRSAIVMVHPEEVEFCSELWDTSPALTRVLIGLAWPVIFYVLATGRVTADAPVDRRKAAEDMMEAVRVRKIANAYFVSARMVRESNARMADTIERGLKDLAAIADRVPPDLQKIARRVAETTYQARAEMQDATLRSFALAVLREDREELAILATGVAIHNDGATLEEIHEHGVDHAFVIAAERRKAAADAERARSSATTGAAEGPPS